jgi:hypothetical protein
MAGGDRMAMIAFNESATMLGQPTSDKNALKAAVDALEPSFGGTRFYEAFTLADRVFSQMGLAQRELVIVSDFQRNGWNRSSRESVIGSDVKTEFVNLSVQNSSNVGIDSVGIEPPISFARTYNGRVIARIHNHRKDQPVTVPVSVSLNDRETARKTVTIAPNSTTLAEFTGFDLPLGTSKGRVRIEGEDPLKLDNDFLFSLERREKLSVLVVDNGRARQSFFLRQAYTSSEDLPYAVTVIPLPKATPDEIAKYDVVVINDVPRISGALQNRLDELRKTGQGQLIILGDGADIGAWQSYAKLPVKVNQKIYVSKDRGRSSVSLTTYDRTHTIFKPFETSTHLALNTAQFLFYIGTEAKPGATVLAKFDDGAPVLVESSKEDHGLLVFTTTVDNRLNDFPLKPSFLPLFHEMIAYLSRYNESRGWYALGEGIPVTAGLESAAAAVIDPTGGRQSLGQLSSGQSRFYAPVMPGFHEIRVGPDTRLVAVNPPAAEGNLESMPPEDLLASVQRTQGESQAAGFFDEEDQEEYARNQTGWWYFLLFALLAGIAEIYIANRASSKAPAIKLGDTIK